MGYQALIDIETFRKHKANTAIFDCRFDLMKPSAGWEQYLEGHIPGAVYADLETVMSSSKTKTSGRHPLPSKEHFIQFLQQHGVNNDTQIVLYDASGGLFAARFWWLCRWVGHSSVAILEKGIERWLALGEQLSTKEPELPTQIGNILIRDTLETVVDVDQIEALVNQNTQNKIVDVRAVERFEGNVEPIDPIAGHIPGAMNIPLGLNYDDQGLFLAQPELKALYHLSLGDYRPYEPIFMCGSGVTACLSRFTIELAELPPVSIYPGSWSEWITDEKRPVKRGP